MKRGLRFPALLTAIVLLAPFAGCGALVERVDLEGCVRVLNLEGGCLVLDATNGKRYELYGMRPSPGYVRLRAKILRDHASACMVGIMVEVESYTVLQQQCPQTSARAHQAVSTTLSSQVE